jgi:hypothetical protein
MANMQLVSELNNMRVIHGKALWSMQANLNAETKFKANSAKQKIKLESEVTRLVQTKKQLKAERDELRAALESVGTALKLSEARLSMAQDELNNTLFNQSKVLETMQFNLNSFNLTNEFNSGLDSVQRFETTSFASFIFFPLFSFFLIFLGFFYLLKKKKNQKGNGDGNEMYLKEIVKKQEI